MSTTTAEGHSPCRSAGFTLLEVLVALAVVAFAFVGLLGLQARNIKMIARDQNVTRATLLARELASQVEYQVLVNGIDSIRDGGGPMEGYDGYSFDQRVLSTGLDEMREVVIRVMWAGDPGVELVLFVRGETAV